MFIIFIKKTILPKYIQEHFMASHAVEIGLLAMEKNKTEKYFTAFLTYSDSY